jgi:hypothetical protein
MKTFIFLTSLSIRINRYFLFNFDFLGNEDYFFLIENRFKLNPNYLPKCDCDIPKGVIKLFKVL